MDKNATQMNEVLEKHIKTFESFMAPYFCEEKIKAIRHLVGLAKSAGAMEIIEKIQERTGNEVR